jgi:7-carboxy-7-deazaguanine synthase
MGKVLSFIIFPLIKSTHFIAGNNILMLQQANQVKENFLNLTEIFSSIQGETSLSGLPTVFVRLAACNLRCSWCDTTYSFGRGMPTSFSDLYRAIENYGCRYICITGGEPLLQSNIHPFMSSLCNQNYKVSLETGGSLSIETVDPRVHIILDIKCPASGMSTKNYWENLNHLRPKDEVKFVLLDQDDYLYAQNICTKYHLSSKVNHILFSPVHGKLDPKILINWILEDKLPVRLNLQMHKYVWSPDTRGV